MHTDTPETRTQFLATPQFGFTPAYGTAAMRFEPIHDFLVVQFGTAGEIARATPAARRPATKFRTGDLP